MKTIIIERDGKRALKFDGELLADVSSTDSAFSVDFSGEMGRWQTFLVYRSYTDKFICQRIDYTCWQGERDRFSAAAFSTLDEIHVFFGYGWLAKKLYAKLNLQFFEWV